LSGAVNATISSVAVDATILSVTTNATHFERDDKRDHFERAVTGKSLVPNNAWAIVEPPCGELERRLHSAMVTCRPDVGSLYTLSFTFHFVSQSKNQNQSTMLSMFTISSLFLAGLLLPTVSAQTICSKYTVALFKNDTGANQLSLLTAVVDLAVDGNATLKVPGILAPEGGLVGIFNGAGPTTNRGDKPVTINFIDGSANTRILSAHLYQFFGALLGCTAAGFPSYTGDPDMFRVHKFMNITKAQNDFFIGQVGAAASALGVVAADVTTIATVLNKVFNTRCPPALTAADGVPAFLVGTNPSICTASSCPLAANSTCSATAAPSSTPCGLFRLSLFCLNGCGLFGRLLGLCRN
jgi:hypothetical protein